MITFSPMFTRLPADRFFWAVLDAPGLTRPGPLPESLLPELAEDLPVPVEEVFAVATPASDRKLLVCAIRRADLQNLAPSLQGLYPDSIPESLGVKATAASLNFLVGEFVPLHLRRASTHRHLRHAAFLLVAVGLTSLGLVRRAAHDDRIAMAAQVAADELVTALAPGQSPVTATLAIDQELERLARAAKADSALVPPPDAAVQLQHLLAAWPAQVSSKPQSLSVLPTSIMASVALEGDASAFLHALHPPQGWTLEEPRMNSAAGITRVSLQMKPSNIQKDRAP